MRSAFLWHARAVAQARLALVAGLRIDAIQFDHGPRLLLGLLLSKLRSLAPEEHLQSGGDGPYDQEHGEEDGRFKQPIACRSVRMLMRPYIKCDSANGEYHAENEITPRVAVEQLQKSVHRAQPLSCGIPLNLGPVAEFHNVAVVSGDATART